jgi:hypothetical protein
MDRSQNTRRPADRLPRVPGGAWGGGAWGAARLAIVGAPAGIKPGVAEFNAFGEVRKP